MHLTHPPAETQSRSERPTSPSLGARACLGVSDLFEE